MLQTAVAQTLDLFAIATQEPYDRCEIMCPRAKSLRAKSLSAMSLSTMSLSAMSHQP
jgi:hypothetical protein